jgi:hypothetical protein
MSHRQLAKDLKAQRDVILLYRQGRSYSMIEELTGFALTTIARFLKRQYHFNEWKRESKRNRKLGRRSKPIELEPELIVYPPDFESPIQPCPECNQMVHMSKEPDVPCFACQVRRADRRAQVYRC